MKNKKFTYILLPLVLLVWAGVVYKFLNLKNKEEIPVMLKRQILSDTTKAEMKDFTISLNYGDPFLKKKKKEKVKVDQPIKLGPPRRSVVIPQKRTVRARRTVKWPDIVYRGVITDNGNKVIGLLEIENNKHIVDKGSIVKEMKVLFLNNDSLMITFENDTQTVKLNHSNSTLK